MVKLASTVPSVFSRATLARFEPLMAVNEPPRSSLPSACKARASTEPPAFTPAPAKPASSVSSLFKRATPRWMAPL